MIITLHGLNPVLIAIDVDWCDQLHLILHLFHLKTFSHILLHQRRWVTKLLFVAIATMLPSDGSSSAIHYLNPRSTQCTGICLRISSQQLHIFLYLFQFQGFCRCPYGLWIHLKIWILFFIANILKSLIPNIYISKSLVISSTDIYSQGHHHLITIYMK